VKGAESSRRRRRRRKRRWDHWEENVQASVFFFSPAVSDSVLRVFSLPWFVTESKERETERDREKIERFNFFALFFGHLLK